MKTESTHSKGNALKILISKSKFVKICLPAFFLFYLNSAAQVGTLTGWGMSLCQQFNFTVCPDQIITPNDYGLQGYACDNIVTDDVSFINQGPSWRVNKYNWDFVATTSGILKGYDPAGVLQSAPFSMGALVAPVSYTNILAVDYVQFNIAGSSVPFLLNQNSFTLSVNGVVSQNSYTYCPKSTGIAISPSVSPGGPFTFTWLPGNLSGQTVTVFPNSTTVYTVSATSTVGCISKATVTVSVKSGCNVGIDEFDLAGNGLYSLLQNEPNPFTHETRIRYTISEKLSGSAIVVFDLSGRQVGEFPLAETGTSSIIIHSDELAPGVYLYTLNGSVNSGHFKKMIVRGE